MNANADSGTKKHDNINKDGKKIVATNGIEITIRNISGIFAALVPSLIFIIMSMLSYLK
jgi:hypothetical protein